uniref:Uncharacterized protein n=1 Tax=Arundo donax TaxID=35708 RepID=A0A0A9CRH2_ARUDO
MWLLDYFTFNPLLILDYFIAKHVFVPSVFFPLLSGSTNVLYKVSLQFCYLSSSYANCLHLLLFEINVLVCRTCSNEGIPNSNGIIVCDNFNFVQFIWIIGGTSERRRHG